MQRNRGETILQWISCELTAGIDVIVQSGFVYAAAFLHLLHQCRV